MSDYDDTNTGTLFKNDKQGNEKRPDYTGKINIEGREMRLAAWLRTSKKGNKFMSLRVSDMEENGGAQKQEPKRQPAVDEDIPF